MPAASVRTNFRCQHQLILPSDTAAGDAVTISPERRHSHWPEHEWSWQRQHYLNGEAPFLVAFIYALHSLLQEACRPQCTVSPRWPNVALIVAMSKGLLAASAA